MASVAHPLFSGLPETALVPTSWLADHLGAEELVVLDATVLTVPGFHGTPSYVSGEEEYLVAGHIPGAVFADLFEAFSDPEGEYAFTRPSAKHFERAAEEHGINNDTAVVIYDTVLGQWAARLWWLFRSFGFEVRVLDGGLAKWRAEGRPVETGDVRPRRAGDFSAYEHNEAWADRQDVERIMAGTEDGLLVCGLPAREFAGEVGIRPRPGHIPGSISAPAARLVDPVTNAYLPADRLREVLGAAADSLAPIVAYCGSAIAATSDALALSLIGRNDVRVYDGSLNEWAADASAPLATGEEALTVAAAAPGGPGSAE